MSDDGQGCFRFVGGCGCVLLLAVLVLPVSTCFGGSKMRGWEAAVAIAGYVVRGQLLFLLPIYATVATVAGAIALQDGRVSRGLRWFVLPAPLAALASLVTPLQIGWVVWFVAVVAVTLATLVRPAR
ncbi:MAG TPA: hypothetical protein VF824_05595 [Thermoanaerobaculia bacterium]|jgi:hypothetical protein